MERLDLHIIFMTDLLIDSENIICILTKIKPMNYIGFFFQIAAQINCNTL